MGIAAAPPPVSLEVTGDIWSETIELGPRGAPVSRTLQIPVGRHRIRFRCDGEPAVAPHDPRHLVFRVDDPHLRVAGD
jgi:hypothetical protein